jgi:methylthioribulose-1-phosphate dehydratase
VAPADVLLVDGEGRALEPGRPSAETLLHAAIYRRYATANAVIHTHSVAATVLSLRHLESGALVLRGYEMQKALAGVTDHQSELRLPIVANSQDMIELGARVDQALGPASQAYLVAGHGLTCWGADCETALRHAEGLEFLLACELERGRR